jgi:hypothetical protein
MWTVYSSYVRYSFVLTHLFLSVTCSFFVVIQPSVCRPLSFSVTTNFFATYDRCDSCPIWRFFLTISRGRFHLQNSSFYIFVLFRGFLPVPVAIVRHVPISCIYSLSCSLLTRHEHILSLLSVYFYTILFLVSNRASVSLHVCSPYKLTSSAETWSWCAPCVSNPSLFPWTFLIAHSKAKLKINGYKESPCFRPFWMKMHQANVYPYGFITGYILTHFQ